MTDPAPLGRRLRGRLARLLRAALPARRRPVEEVFGEFRAVMAAHDQALEIVADIGEKLGGEYLFDAQYLRDAYARLAARVAEMIEGFDRLVEGRHPGLGRARDLIDREVRRLLYDLTPPGGALVLPLEEMTWERSAEVGGKISKLAEVRNHLGLRVPEGFGVTTGAFDAYIRHNGIDRLLQTTAAGGSAAWGPTVHERVLQGELPAALADAVAAALAALAARHGPSARLAIRSSAVGEDGDYSFAGQFATVLNVPLEPGAVAGAYRTVLASLYTDGALTYLRHLGMDPAASRMAVGCLLMVPARASGVLYTRDPEAPGSRLIISAAWGLGAAVVEGSAEADQLVVARDPALSLVQTRIGRKSLTTVPAEDGATRGVPTPEAERDAPALSPQQALELARQALRIESHFRRPMDVEWALDGSGRFFILQARPLRFRESGAAAGAGAPPAAQPVARLAGTVVQRGTAAGKVFVLRSLEDVQRVPRGALLVARHDSSEFISAMPIVAAIVTEVGSPTSHMAALCREFRLPAVVNAGPATAVLADGRDVTLVADEQGAAIYEGLVPELLRTAQAAAEMKDLYEFRRKRSVLTYLTTLTLVDPDAAAFTPAGCRSLHDILRFVHEKALQELLEGARRGVGGRAMVRLELPVPAGILAVDIGGGLAPAAGASSAGPDRVASLPLRAVLAGLLRPGAWHTESIALGMGDLLGSVMRMPDLADAAACPSCNVAVVSREYLNLSIKFGYHYSVLDAIATADPRRNHVYFRFSGGATDMAKRSRRLELIALILRHFGFAVRIKGDLLVARLDGADAERTRSALDQLGRLMAYTRQLDAVLTSDERAAAYAAKFLDGDLAL
jgi:pyruvate,water dikinase